MANLRPATREDFDVEGNVILEYFPEGGNICIHEVTSNGIWWFWFDEKRQTNSSSSLIWAIHLSLETEVYLVPQTIDTCSHSEHRKETNRWLT